MDKNFRSYADVSNVVVENETISPPDDSYADTLKFSKATNVVVQNCTIIGGREDCVDMNRYCENILLHNVKLYSRGKYGATIKGGTKKVHLCDIEICKHGGEVDIDLGNRSEQSNELTREIVLENVHSTDGKPVIVRVLWADIPTIIGGNVKVISYPKWMVKIIFFFLKIFS